MAQDERLICRSSALTDGGVGVRFMWRAGSQLIPAFAVRFGGTVRAFLNRCSHMPMELDWAPGRFFDTDGQLLICSTHGAAYHPLTGQCRDGPCEGAGLQPLDVVERDDAVYLDSGQPGRVEPDSGFGPPE